MIKPFLKVLLVGLFLFVFALSAHAQLQTDSNEIKTRVGDPKTAPGDLLSWTQQISEALERGYDGGYNKMLATISNGSYTAPTSVSTNIGNKYWCTYLAIDAYNLSGVSGLNRASHGAVVYMMGFWKQTQGYRFIDYYSGNHQSTLGEVQPGYVIFFQATPGMTTLGEFDHVAVVKSLTLNPQGDGTLETYDSNTSYGKVLTYPVDGWSIKGLLTNPSTYSVMGFGTVQ